MTLGIATLIICVFVFIGAYSIEKGLKDLIVKRLDAQEKALEELRTELGNLRDTLEDMKLPLYDDEGEE
jgi:hypothetical protein